MCLSVTFVGKQLCLCAIIDKESCGMKTQNEPSLALKGHWVHMEEKVSMC